MFVKNLKFFIILIMTFSCMANDNLVFEKGNIAVDHFQQNRMISNDDENMDFLFSELNYKKFKKGMGFTRITRLSDERILFEGKTPEFTNFYISDDNIVVAYNQYDYHFEPNLAIFDPQGKVIFMGYADIYLDLFEQNQNLDSPMEQYSTPLSYSNPDDSFLRVNMEESNNERIIIVGCGGYRTAWIDSIVSIDMDSNNAVRGIWFSADKKIKYFDLIKHQELLTINNADLENRINTVSNSSCQDNEFKSYFDGLNYSTWCENERGERTGEFVRWINLEDNLESTQRDVKEDNLEVKISQEYLLYIEGDYGVNGRKNTWKINDVYSNTFCSFERDKLHGSCTEYEKEIKVSMKQYKQGKANGLDLNYFPDGSIEYKDTRVNGLIEGVSTEYFDDGGVDYTTTYLNGLEHGESCSYFRTGELDQCNQYEHGELVRD